MNKCLSYKMSLRKIIPVCKKEYTCCICMEKSTNVSKCSKCIDGIICHNCRGKLSEHQQKLCPICRCESDSFIIEIKDTFVPVIEIDTENENNKKCKIVCEINYYCIDNFIKVFAFIISFILLSLVTGLIVVSSFTNGNVENTSLGGYIYIIIFLVGFVLNSMCCICSSRCLKSFD